MEEALRAKLLAVGAFKAVCPKVVWDERPQGVYPATVLTLVSPGREYTHDGWDGLDETRVQVDIWDIDRDGASGKATTLAISRALVAAIEPTTTIGGYEIGPAFLDNEDGGGTEDLGGGTKVYRRRMDWIITNRPVVG